MTIITRIAIFGVLFSPIHAWSASDTVNDDQVRQKALKIIGQYGTDGQMSRIQLRNYLNNEAFKVIDTDKDKVLQFIEFRDAKLYCTRADAAQLIWKCDNNPTITESIYARITAGADLSASRMMTQDQITWGPIIEQQVDAWWERAEPPAANSLDTLALVRVLKANAKLAAQSPARKLMAKVVDYREAGNVLSLDELELDILLIGIGAADTNFSGTVDPLEFVKAFDGPKVIADYNALISLVTPRAPMLDVANIGRTDVGSGRASDTLTHILWQYSDLLKYASEGAAGETQEVDAIHAGAEAAAAIEDKARERRAVRNGPFGSAYVKNRGIVFPGSAATFSNVSKAVELKDNVPLVAVRVIEDFTKAGAKANAGSISWSKDAGSSPSPNFGVAVRADWYLPKWDRFTTDGWRVRPAAGVQYNRVGRGDDKSDVRKAFLMLDSYLGDGEGFLRMNHLQVGPVFEKDQVERVDKITGLIEWEPVVAFPGFTTGVYYPLTNNVRWYFRPRFAIELNDIREKPAGSTVTDRSFYRYGGELGLQFGERTTLTYDYRQRHATNDTDEDYHFQNAQLDWQIDELGVFKLTLGFSQGRDTPAFERVEQYKLGLGVKY